MTTLIQFKKGTDNELLNIWGIKYGRLSIGATTGRFEPLILTVADARFWLKDMIAGKLTDPDRAGSLETEMKNAGIVGDNSHLRDLCKHFNGKLGSRYDLNLCTCNNSSYLPHWYLFRDGEKILGEWRKWRLTDIEDLLSICTKDIQSSDMNRDDAALLLQKAISWELEPNNDWHISPDWSHYNAYYEVSLDNFSHVCRLDYPAT